MCGSVKQKFDIVLLKLNPAKIRTKKAENMRQLYFISKKIDLGFPPYFFFARR